MRSFNSPLTFASLATFAASGLGSGDGTDPLADLGLDLGGDTVVATADGNEVVAGEGDATVDASAGAVVEGGAATEEVKEKQTRTAVKVGEVEFEEVDLIPAIKRGGGGGKGESKYDFDKLTAPVAKDGGGFRYSTFTVLNVEGQDFKALQRSVQSAATAQNREHKADGSATRFITRTKLVDDAAAGVIVFRVDNTIDEEA